MFEGINKDTLYEWINMDKDELLLLLDRAVKIVKKLEKENYEFKKELEEYRPTRLKGESLTTCYHCGKLHLKLNCFRYKDEVLCEDCLKKKYNIQI